MKIMYVASQPDDGAELSIGQEIGQLQSQLLSRGLPNLECAFYSDLTVEQFRATVSGFAPDILHISAHSDYGALRLRNTNKEVININAKKLQALIPQHATPSLLVLSSCNSSELLRDLTHPNRMRTCITFKGRVKLSVASLVTIHMYEGILAGGSLGEVVDDCEQRLEVEQPGDVGLAVFTGQSDWRSTQLYSPPAIVVRPVQKTLRMKKDGNPAPNLFEVGLDGAPTDVVQIIFFTDEREWANDSDYDNESELTLECWRASRMAKVVYGPTPTSGCLWSNSPEEQSSDERLYAVAVRGNGSSFVVKSSVSEGMSEAVSRGLCTPAVANSIPAFVKQLQAAARTRSAFNN